MAAALKPTEFDYIAAGSVTGLTDVKGTLVVNGVTKAYGLASVEVDNTNAKGLYRISLTAANLVSYGVVAGQQNTLIMYMKSTSLGNVQIARVDLTVATTDDIYALLGTPAGASVSADIASIYSRLGAPAAASVSADIAALNAQNVNLLSQITALANATQTGGASIVQLQAEIPSSGNTFPLLVPIVIRNADGVNVAPTSISVTMANGSGVDRGSYITGATQTGSNPYSLTPTAASTGVYNIPVVIPSSAVEEQDVMKVTYVYNGQTYTSFAVIELVSDIANAGYATASALAAVAANVTSTLNAINNSTSGLSAIQTAQAAQTALLQSTTFGLSAIQTNVSSVGTAVSNGISQIEGVNFTVGRDDLASISVWMRNYLANPAKAV